MEDDQRMLYYLPIVCAFFKGEGRGNTYSATDYDAVIKALNNTVVNCSCDCYTNLVAVSDKAHCYNCLEQEFWSNDSKDMNSEIYMRNCQNWLESGSIKFFSASL